MYPSETAARHSAQYDPFWTFFNLICWRNLALLRTPNKIIFWIGQLKQIFGTFVRKRKIIPFFRSEVFVLLSKFQSSCSLLGCKQRFLLPSQRSPTFAFINLQMVFFFPTWPLLGNCCESCLVEFPLLYLALFRILLTASSRISVFLFFSCLQTRHFLTTISLAFQRSDFFQLFGNFFNWQASRSKYRCLGFQIAELFSINRVHLSRYSQTKERLWAIQDTTYDKYLAGKYKRACTPLAGKCKNWIFQ